MILLMFSLKNLSLKFCNKNQRNEISNNILLYNLENEIFDSWNETNKVNWVNLLDDFGYLVLQLFSNILDFVISSISSKKYLQYIRKTWFWEKKFKEMSDFNCDEGCVILSLCNFLNNLIKKSNKFYP